MNSTETPGGSGISAGWYDDPSGHGLRWWDGEQWTEHVHIAESAAGDEGAAGTGAVRHEGAPPRDLVKLRERIHDRGAKSVGLVLGGIVLVIVIIALLLSGGSDKSGGGFEPGVGGAGTGGPAAGAPAKEAAKLERELQKQLKGGKGGTKAAKKALKAEEKALEKAGGKGVKKQIEAAEKAAEQALKGAE